MAKVANIGQPSICWPTSGKRIGSIRSSGPGQLKVKVGRTVPNTLIVSLTIGHIATFREGASALSVVLNQGSSYHAN